MKTYEVLLLVETSRAYGRGVIEGIAKYADEQGNWSLHFEDRSLHDRLPFWLKHWKGNGVIARSTTPSQRHEIQQLNIPCVELFGATSPEVCCDDILVARMAAEHFLSRGLYHFAFFAPEMPWWCTHRFKQFERCLHLFGHSCHCFRRKRHHTQTLSPTWNASDDRLLKDWLLQLPKPVGLFAATDAYSLTVLGACRRLGIRVPGEVAILGADNDKTICLSVTPRLSSIDVNNALTGYKAAELLDLRMKKKKTSSLIPILIPPAYVVERQSTDMVAIDDDDTTEALVLIRKYATEGITIAEVARRVGLSQSTLTRRFHRYFGYSPEQELVRCKIDYAKRCLRETTLPTYTVGKKAGFTPPEYFARAFKREVGMTPNQFRRAFQSRLVGD